MKRFSAFEKSMFVTTERRNHEVLSLLPFFYQSYYTAFYRERFVCLPFGLVILCPVTRIGLIRSL